MGDLTPMLRQYRRLKEENPEALLLFRLGDFYEAFYDDAKVVARELEITLTARGRNTKHEAPMCGIPHHAAENHVASLIQKGHRVAIAEQVEDPAMARGLVDRQVIRVITPGTIIDSRNLELKENNYLASLLNKKDLWGVACLDLSTGDFFVTEREGPDAISELRDRLAAISPREVLCPKELDIAQLLEACHPPPALSRQSAEVFSAPKALRALEDHLPSASWSALESSVRPITARAAGAILTYIQKTQKSRAPHITTIRYESPGATMMLDAITCRTLELFETLLGRSSKGSLLWLLDQTVTSFGGRLLRKWLAAPLSSTESLAERLNAVEELAKIESLRRELREQLKGCYDVERLLSRIALGSANSRDLVALRNSLRLLPETVRLLQNARSSLLRQLLEAIDPLPDLEGMLTKALVDEPPATVREGGMIRQGHNDELDRLRDTSHSGKKALSAIEQRERERTGISSLKVKYNRVFGYFIEVSKANLDRVPELYVRKQTLVNAERFVTEELKEFEKEILLADERSQALEYSLFCELRDHVTAQAGRIRKTAIQLAQLDVLAAFAHLAKQEGYTRPELYSGGEIVIHEGRHPVVEKMQDEEFIPNDTYLNNEAHQIQIVTGPNMGGKSTYLRQVALITLMAQMGSFVPAKKARIGIVDRIFTRVGATDNLMAGSSTFFLEMTETAHILHNATDRSLVILDEIGRGTSTFDGLSLAWAVVEHLHEGRGAHPKTLFATHYHELTELGSLLERVENLRMAVKELGNEILFLRQVEPGRADRSYGIHVARIAGIPAEVISRATEILDILERNEKDAVGMPKLAYHQGKPIRAKPQLSLFEESVDPIRSELEQLELTTLSPPEAVRRIGQWKELLQRERRKNEASEK